MGVTAVVGLQWGDEGKGKVVDILSQRADVAVRCQGGANAGHTVVVKGRRFILHLVPSAILTDGILCVIGDGVVVDLDVLDREIEELGRAGFPVDGRLVVSTRAHVVLPVHKELELLQERSRGDARLDTTGRGIGPCYSDKHARLGIRVGDILEPAALGGRVTGLFRAYAAFGRGGLKSSIEANLAYLELHTGLVKRLAGDTGSLLRQSLSQEKKVILEGSQGFMLDVDHGTYPFVTSSNTGVHGLATGSGLAPARIDRVVGVVKAYVTRVGAGPLPTAMEEPVHSEIRQKGGEYGATTGRPRRCGWLDLAVLRYACALNGVTSIAVTKLDTLSGLSPIKVCEAYDLKGTRLDRFPARTEVLEECEPVYSLHEGWDTLEGISRTQDLPQAALAYVERIGEAASAEVELLSTGPGREDVLRLGS
jgi:adenylosuccinate synthase